MVNSILTRAEFARELSTARVRAGLTVRELAKRLQVPAGTLGDYFSGRHIPSASQLLLFQMLLAECGITDANSVAEWTDALNRVRVASDGRAGRATAPYRGLEPFQSEDAELFFGRETATTTVLARLSALCRDPGPSNGLLAVIGPSGSGKSSLLRAGVMPQINAGVLDTGSALWRCDVMTPGTNPTRSLTKCLANIDSPHRVLVIDQFEEVFTLNAAVAPRREFIGTLDALDPRDVLVVIGMRADFYATAAAEPELLMALQYAQVLVGPMIEKEVRRAIVEPARHVGVAIDDGLVDLLLADLAPRGMLDFAHDAGVLPLLSHALLATWERAPRNHLTIAAYREVGGVHGAIQQTAEELYHGLSPAEQELARRIFLRLVNVDDDARTTRRRVGRAEIALLTDELGNGAAVDTVLDRFIAGRLITADRDTIGVSHEALLSTWPRLRDWLDADRAGLRLRRQLTEAANGWQSAGCDDALLLRGGRLEAVAEWAAQPEHRDELNRVERDFLDAGVKYAEANRRALRLRTRRLHQLLAALTTILLFAIVSTVYAFDARASADRTRDDAQSREVAIESSRLTQTDPALATQLALAAYRISPTADARAALLDASARETPTRMLGPSGPTMVAITRDGRLMADVHAGDGSIDLYSLTTQQPRRIVAVPGPKPAVQLFALALSPDGRILAVGGSDDRVTMYDIADPGRPVAIASLGGFSSAVQSVAFSPDGNTIAVASGSTDVRRWKITVPAHPIAQAPLSTPSGAAMQSVAFSPDNRLLAAGGTGGALVIWRDDNTNADSVALATSSGNSDLNAVAFSPDGRTLATAGKDAVVRVWSVGDGDDLTQAHNPLTGFQSWVNALAFSANGQLLAAGSSDNSVLVWNTTSWAQTTTFEHPDPVTGVAFSPAGHTLVSGAANGTVSLWSLPTPEIDHLAGNVFGIAYAADARVIASITTGDQGAASLWNVSNTRAPAPVSVPIPLPATFGPVAGAGAMTSDGKLLAVANRQGRVQLVDISDARHPQMLATPLSGASALIEQLAFNPDATLLAGGDDDTDVYLWDVHDPAHPRPLPPIAGSASMVLSVAFSPDGRILAAASADDDVRLWDVADPAHPLALAKLTGFANYANTVTFSPDGYTLVAGSADHTVRLWDVHDPSKPIPLGQPLAGPNDYVYSISISPDGHTLAAGSTDDSVWVWDIRNRSRPRLLATLRAATGPVFVVAISPDGRTLAAGGGDQTIHFWDLDLGSAVAQICSTAGDPITHAEWAQYVPGAPYDPPCPTSDVVH